MSFDLIRRQREERLRRLREKKNDQFNDENEQDLERSGSSLKEDDRDKGSYSWQDELWDDDIREEREPPPDKVKSSFFIKVVISMFMLSFTYIVYHTDTPVSNQGKQFIGEVMTREFNFQGVVAVVEHKFGISPDILPAIRTQTSTSQPTWMPGGHEQTFLSPSSGEIVTSFDQDGTAVHIATQDREVQAIDQGWVLDAAPTEGSGHTVTIIHSNGTKSTYSGLGEIEVAKEDWVQPGQSIGRMEPGSTLRFSLQVEDDYIDPTSVITFE